MSFALTHDTIAAIATASGMGGVGVIRISGNISLRTFCQQLTDLSDLPIPRHAHFCRFLDAQHQAIDEGLLLYFPAPHSFTGEDVLELHGHGGRIVLAQLLRRCLELGARLAQPGEFSQRAFLNHKIDLTQAEAIADLITAGTEQAARSAVRSLSGVFSQQINALSTQIINLRMYVEATIDFPEEEIEFVGNDYVIKNLHPIQDHLKHLISQAQQGNLLRDGLSVVIAGQPNVGKSSLLNALLGQERAIVTPIAGTTRDVIDSELHIEGVPLHIIDTAGLRETDDLVEKIGIERTWQAINNTADLALLLVDATQGFSAADQLILAAMPSTLPVILVLNKMDLPDAQPESLHHLTGIMRHVKLSALTGAGIDTLRHTLLELVGWQPTVETPFIARTRHLDGLRRVQKHLDAVMLCATQFELIAEELRLAHVALGEISGTFTSEDLLSVIFGNFCIGK